MTRIGSAALLALVCLCAIVIETRATECLGKWKAVQCDGCQCCPNGCVCPSGKSCPEGTCPNTGAECRARTTSTKGTTPPTTTVRLTTTVVSNGTTGGVTQTTTGGTTPGTFTTTTPGSVAPGTLILNDEFDSLNFKLWKHELSLTGGGNWEFQAYQNNRTTSYVRDGILYIKPGLTADLFGSNGDAEVRNGRTLDIWGSSPADACTSNFQYGCLRTSGAGGNYINPITSARLRTAEHFAFKYGRVEVRAKLPRGDWLWPAIWMLPRDNEYGNWPASGEIDIVESRGNLQYPSSAGGGAESFGSTLHFGPAYDADHYEKAHAVYSLPGGKTFNDDFHTFGCVWGPDRIYTYIDTEDNKVLDLPIKQDFWSLGEFGDNKPWANPWSSSQNNDAPFDKEYYLILNLAVGGTGGYFPDGVGGKPWTNADQHAVNAFYNNKANWYSTWDRRGEDSALQVDSVKVWSL